MIRAISLNGPASTCTCTFVFVIVFVCVEKSTCDSIVVALFLATQNFILVLILFVVHLYHCYIDCNYVPRSKLMSNGTAREPSPFTAAHNYFISLDFSEDYISSSQSDKSHSGISESAHSGYYTPEVSVELPSVQDMLRGRSARKKKVVSKNKTEEVVKSVVEEVEEEVKAVVLKEESKMSTVTSIPADDDVAGHASEYISPTPDTGSVEEPVKDESNFEADVTQKVYEGVKDTWGNIAGIGIFTPFLKTAEGVANKVLSVKGLDLEKVDGQLKPFFASVDGAVNPHVSALLNAMKPFAEKVVPIVMAPAGLIMSGKKMTESSTAAVDQ